MRTFCRAGGVGGKKKRWDGMAEAQTRVGDSSCDMKEVGSRPVSEPEWRTKLGSRWVAASPVSQRAPLPVAALELGQPPARLLTGFCFAPQARGRRPHPIDASAQRAASIGSVGDSSKNEYTRFRSFHAGSRCAAARLPLGFWCRRLVGPSLAGYLRRRLGFPSPHGSSRRRLASSTGLAG